MSVGGVSIHPGQGVPWHASLEELRVARGAVQGQGFGPARRVGVRVSTTASLHRSHTVPG